MNPQTDIQKLLRLKRYEGPPSGFHEDFLQEFQRRQRVDLLRRTLKPSVREVVAERMHLSLSKLRIPALAYASIAALGVASSLFILSHSPGRTSKNTAIAAATSVNDRYVSASALTLPVDIPNPRTVGTLPPSYSLENEPVSYQAPLGF